MSRARREDWCDVGLALLKKEGHGALTIDRVALALGKTKGSFYHHFQDLDGYHAALLATWENELTTLPIEVSSRESSAQARARRLDQVVRRLDFALDRAVRAWAYADPRAERAVRKVDERRIAYLARLHEAAGRRRPRELAELEYAAFVGAEHVQLLGEGRRGPRLGRLLEEALSWLGRPCRRP